MQLPFPTGALVKCFKAVGEDIWPHVPCRYAPPLALVVPPASSVSADGSREQQQPKRNRANEDSQGLIASRKGFMLQGRNEAPYQESRRTYLYGSLAWSA